MFCPEGRPTPWPGRATRRRVLSFDHISFAFPGATWPLLGRLSLRVEQGESLAILGPSGVGKTTLLQLAAGLLRPDSGRVRVGDVVPAELAEGAAARWRARHLGFVFQDFRLLPHLSVLDNVLLPLVLARQAPDAERAAGLLERLGLGALAQTYPERLSGGEAQRVAVARALVHRPALILADEPTGNLDPQSGLAVARLLLEQAAQLGATVLLVTHDPQVGALAQRRCRLGAAGLEPA